VARNFLDGKGLILSYERIAKIPPVYPLFLSGVSFLFGEGYWTIRIVQTIISSISCILIYFLGREFIDKSTGITAALIAVVYPFFIFWGAFILTETLFVFLLLLTVYFFHINKKIPNIRNGVIAGILLGISILCRPSLIVFVFVLLVSLTISSLWLGWENRFKIIGVILAFTILTISPWSVRNFYHFRRFIPLTTMTGSSFWEGNNLYSSGGPCQYLPKEVKGLSEVERDRYLTKATLKVIKDNPLRFLKLLGIKFLRFWNIMPNYEGFSSPLYTLVSLFSYIPVIITAIYGMFLTRKKWRNFLLFYMLFFSFTLGHMLFVSSIRYRVTIMPFMIIFSAYGINQIYRRIKGNNIEGKSLVG
jgi:4-amino-4-deoxy-L-arabinose transferase-like glycosyltransferase